MIVVDVIDERLLGVHVMITEETLVEFANAVTCSKVKRHFTANSNLLITMLAFHS